MVIQCQAGRMGEIFQVDGTNRFVIALGAINRIEKKL
jgi:hypothetical protein